jgi:hypothetical protein
MKIISSKKAKKLSFILLILIVISVAMFYLFVNYVDIEEVATALNINKYEVRSELLLSAINKLGVCKPEDAVNTWSEGLRTRNAAMQYSVMTNKLKEEYFNQLEKTFSNWVTGMSSPWIDSYKIIKTDKKSDKECLITVQFSTMTSTGPAGDYKAILTVIKDKDFWKISSINADEGLYPYTGFKI